MRVTTRASTTRLPRRAASTWVAVIAALALATGPGRAYAHPGEPPQPHDLWSAWPASILPVVGLAALAILYVRGRSAWHGQGRRLGWRAGAFALGWVSLALALVTPLDSLGHALFTAHMVQHLLLILAAAPLLVLSAPLAPLLQGLPAQAAGQLGAWWRRSGWVRRLWQAISAPGPAWALHALALWVWHAPGLYQAALASEFLHGLEHFSFLGTALLFWWALLHPGRRSAWLAGPGGALYVFTMALQSSLLGALITFSTQPWYPAYAATTAPWGLTPLDDQQLAGAVMWIPAGLVYLGAALGLLGAWFAAMERSEKHQATPPAVDTATGRPT